MASRFAIATAVLVAMADGQQALVAMADGQQTENLTRHFFSGCWVRAFGRGVGELIDSCADGWDQSGLLCYPGCRSGYRGVGPVCWQSCPGPTEGPGKLYRDDGAFCKKKQYYGRGLGHFTQSACEEKEGKVCEKCLLLWYPKCAAGTYKVGCNLCSQICPAGMTDIGISCKKDTITRGLGKLFQCADGLEESYGLCYPPCTPQVSHSLGPICYANCPSGYSRCGGLLCLADDEPQGKCTQIIEQVIDSVKQLSKDFALKNKRGVAIDFAHIAYEMAYPLCKWFGEESNNSGAIVV